MDWKNLLRQTIRQTELVFPPSQSNVAESILSTELFLSIVSKVLIQGSLLIKNVKAIGSGGTGKSINQSINPSVDTVVFIALDLFCKKLTWKKIFFSSGSCSRVWTSSTKLDLEFSISSLSYCTNNKQTTKRSE